MKFFSRLELDTLTHRPKPGDTMLIEDHQIVVAEVSQENERLQLVADVGQKHIDALTSRLTKLEKENAELRIEIAYYEDRGSPASGGVRHE
jgi:hypothetical protein